MKTCDLCFFELNKKCTNAKSLMYGENTDKVKICGQYIPFKCCGTCKYYLNDLLDEPCYKCNEQLNKWELL
jgi:hypothetical protein